ncbi:MAG TPA: hypothetical protein VNT22_08165 [Baekduia sp.]|nr:hypothetical protein [Baekduia sp.]
MQEEMRRAHELGDQLQDEGLVLRYEINEITSRVVATLRDLDGTLVRTVPLLEALAADDDGVPAA